MRTTDASSAADLQVQLIEYLESLEGTRTEGWHKVEFEKDNMIISAEVCCVGGHYSMWVANLSLRPKENIIEH